LRTRAERLFTAGAAVLALALCAAALGGPTALATEPPPGPDCSWGIKSSPDAVNIAYPDLDVTYWAHEFVPVPGERLVIKGEYSLARYFSFHVYDSRAVPLDSVYDARIAPDLGSANPYLAKPLPGSGNSYTEYVDFKAAPSNPAPNTLYVGDGSQGNPAPLATLMYRVYVPNAPADPAGGPLPQVTLQTESGTTLQSYGGCASSSIETGGRLSEEIANSNYPPGAPTPPIEGATNPPTWSRALTGRLIGVFANQQNAYLAATISRQYGGIVVIHGKAPTFPNTRAGDPVYASRQVRYWSICENNKATTRVISCAADYHAAINRGYYTYVISDPQARPANATASNGVTWLPWGGTFSDGYVILRNLLPSPTFAQAIQNVGEGSAPQAVMGPYFPSTVYCAKGTFERGAWGACAQGR
jgi:hypothetical protein